MDELEIETSAFVVFSVGYGCTGSDLSFLFPVLDVIQGCFSYILMDLANNGLLV